MFLHFRYRAFICLGSLCTGLVILPFAVLPKFNRGLAQSFLLLSTSLALLVMASVLSMNGYAESMPLTPIQPSALASESIGVLLDDAVAEPTSIFDAPPLPANSVLLPLNTDLDNSCQSTGDKVVKPMPADSIADLQIHGEMLGYMVEPHIQKMKEFSSDAFSVTVKPCHVQALPSIQELCRKDIVAYLEQEVRGSLQSINRSLARLYPWTIDFENETTEVKKFLCRIRRNMRNRVSQIESQARFSSKFYTDLAKIDKKIAEHLNRIVFYNRKLESTEYSTSSAVLAVVEDCRQTLDFNGLQINCAPDDVHILHLTLLKDFFLAEQGRLSLLADSSTDKQSIDRDKQLASINDPIHSPEDMAKITKLRALLVSAKDQLECQEKQLNQLKSNFDERLASKGQDERGLQRETWRLCSVVSKLTADIANTSHAPEEVSQCIQSANISVAPCPLGIA